jgi:hypothetical protein
MARNGDKSPSFEEDFFSGEGLDDAAAVVSDGFDSAEVFEHPVVSANTTNAAMAKA